MFLGKTKARLHYGIDSPFEDLPERLPLKELIYQINKCRAGDVHARDILVLSHLRMGLSIAAAYANRFPKRKDDIIASMYLGIFEALSKIDRLKDNGISAWITTHIHGAISYYLRHDHLIYIPKDAVANMQAIKLMPYSISISTKEDIDNPYYDTDTEGSLLPSTVDDDEVVVTDFLNHLTKREAKIVNYKMEGYRNVEIAVKMGLSAMRIGQILKEVAMIWEKKHGQK